MDQTGTGATKMVSDVWANDTNNLATQQTLCMFECGNVPLQSVLPSKAYNNIVTSQLINL